MTDQPVHVVAAVLQRGDTCFVQQRQPGKHMAGLWEFPGGKLEPDETVWDGLVRELDEELGIRALRGQPLIQLVHAYADRVIHLDVWRVDAWAGELHAREQQVTAWCTLDELRSLPLLPADGPVIDAMALPHRVFVTPDCDETHPRFPSLIEGAVRRHGLELCILRQTRLSVRTYSRLAIRLADRLHALGCQLIVHGSPRDRAELLEHPHVAGLHVPASAGMALDAVPEGITSLSMSCHTQEELFHAASLGARFALLGSVQATRSHPNASTLGWRGFEDYVSNANLPVYAIGGMGLDDERRSRIHGGQGIAAIRSFLE